jgi:RNA polymerase sigma-70 factor (ECF subfamily)
MGAEAKATQAQRLEENKLLQAVARGDVEALRRLYRSFERPLYSLGMRWLRDPQLAEELVQEVTFRIWRRAKSFDEARGAAGSWIFGVARNVASDLARARSRNPMPVADPPARQEPWDEDAAWRGWQLAQALQRLSIEQQRVMELVYVVQMTQAETAKVLGIPLGTVKTRLYHGLRKLRRELEDIGLTEGERR